MKNVFLALLMVGLVSCASSHKHEESREIASASPKCELVKHKSENWYRVEKDGQPFSKYWYGHGKATARIKEHVANGHCSY